MENSGIWGTKHGNKLYLVNFNSNMNANRISIAHWYWWSCEIFAAVLMILQQRMNIRKTALFSLTLRHLKSHSQMNDSPLMLSTCCVLESVKRATLSLLQGESVISFPPKSLITSAKSDYIWMSSLEREKAGQVITPDCHRACRKRKTEELYS